MDPTLAALAGTALGAAATAAVPLVTIRARRKDAATEQQRADTVALLDAVTRWLKARGINDWNTVMHAHTEAIVALERLLINSSAKDTPHLETVTGFVFQAAGHEDNLDLVAASVEAMSHVLRRWCRGELRGKQIEEAYGPALERQLDLHESRNGRH
ncbi:hypothetical protein [Microbacterium sp.]|uniref:hypothetical protein n=1 Tax=Microbacterium sp. TaxID=51671 RepID=UPI0028AFBF0D|nr:hypothetical protein [Microbacterium sp.]